MLAGIIIFSSCHSKPGQTQVTSPEKLQLVNIEEIRCGAERTELYFPILQNKSIGIVCNHTSVINQVHLVDSLISAGFDIKAIFSPEHGFRGDAEAGAEIIDGIDGKTGIKIISLYGKKKKPLPADLEGIDVLLFDIQDVGVRFYTYISTLTVVMEAASEKGIPVILTDRPNPNGFYVDGPVLDTAFRSFVGMHPVPVVYGMTIGEYASMINEEGWLTGGKCSLTVIPMSGYDHQMIVRLNEKPSPNLPSWQSVYLYPSLCLFEGTIISIGRGTQLPFQVIGHPAYLAGSYIFIPKSIPGVIEHPPFEGQECFGSNLTGFAENFLENNEHFNLEWLLNMYGFFKGSETFFTPYFDKLAGNDQLRNDIISGKTEPEIRKSWEDDLLKFKQIRAKYLIYPE
ncbi:MAG: DUF1343 domain-containing protein [Bacteroidales bacterium]|nr:DUF1343 domain-containing protein [Bacteroidales bacterium]